MKVGILGRLRVTDDRGIEIPVAEGHRRAVLACLAYRAGSSVSLQLLYGAVWGDDPPSHPEASIKNHVSKLNRLLGPGTVEREGDGYVLRLDPADVDYVRFERLAADSREALRAGDWARCVETGDEARGLVQGEPLQDLDYDALDRRIATAKVDRALQELSLIHI